MLHSTEAWVISNTVQQYNLTQLHSVPQEGYVWILLPRLEFIEQLPFIERMLNSKLNEQHIKDAINSEHPSFFDNTEQYELIVFRGIGASHFEMDIPRVSITPISVACFNFDRVLITVFDHDDLAVNKVKDFMLRNAHRTNMSNPSELLYKILHSVVEQILSLRNPFTQQLTEWQRIMLDKNHNFDAWNEFMEFKSVVEQLAALCEDQEDAIEEWQQYSRHIQQQQQFNINLNDLSDHIQRSIRHVQKISAGLDMLIQLHFSAMSHRNNEVLRVLAIISCVFLPLTLITGIFGMNFTNMPILQEHNAYYWTIGLMLGVAFLLLFAFKWRRWL